MEVYAGQVFHRLVAAPRNRWRLKQPLKTTTNCPALEARLTKRQLAKPMRCHGERMAHQLAYHRGKGMD